MPRANPTASFSVAVRHLFRHLREPRALQRNPLVSRFFVDSLEGRLAPARGRDAVAADQILRLIRLAAKRCLDEDIAAGNADRGLRQFAIVTQCYCERKPANVVAAELAISQTELYRQRADICKRVALQLQECNAPKRSAATSVFDARRFQLDRAAARAELGDYDEAIRDYESLIGSSPSVENKVEILCKRAQAELDAGRCATARETLASATRLLETCGAAALPAAAHAYGRAYVELIESRVEWATGNLPSAVAAIRSARGKLDAIADDSTFVKELTFDVLLNSEMYAAAYGDFGDAREMLVRAGRVRAALGDLSLPRQIDYASEQAALEITAARSGCTFTLSEQMSVFSSMLALAKQCGSSKRILQVQTDLVYGLMDQDPGTLVKIARQIMSMARQTKSVSILRSTSVTLADLLAGAGVWAEIPHLLGACERDTYERSEEWFSLMNTKSRYYLHMGQPLESGRCAQAIYEGARAVGNQRYLAGGLLALSAATQALGKRGEATGYVAEALPIAELHSGSLACLGAYQRAAAITGKPKYARAAAELRSALRAG